MVGKKGKSGRKKSAATLAREALEANERLVPKYFEVLRNLAANQNTPDSVRIDIDEYLINRDQGNPRATHDLRLGQGAPLTADDLRKWTQLDSRVEEEQTRLIASLGREVPESRTKRNEVAKVQNVWANIDANTVEVEFLLPKGNIEKKKL